MAGGSQLRANLLIFSSVVCLALASNRGSLLRGMIDSFSRKNKRFRTGDFYDGTSSGGRRLRSQSYKSIVSLAGEGGECEIEVVNNADEIYLFCWVGFDGKLCHYYPVQDNSIKDGSVRNAHREFTRENHAFVCIKRTQNLPAYITDVDADNVLFAFRPLTKGFKYIITIDKVGTEATQTLRDLKLGLTYEEMIDESDVIDTSEKEYIPSTCCGFVTMLEPGVEDVPGFLEALEEDLTQVCNLLPESACKLLQEDTVFWVNKSISFGPKRKPIRGKACTFHPKGGSGWLKKMGMNVNKCGGVEFYSAEGHVSSRKNWGVGGILVHELAHAYHNKHCPNGFDNDDVRNAYTLAMENKLYDCVNVHGKQGLNGPQKAYACTNCMEFFAELSVAYLWQADATEYNKWFPHNHSQLRDHDPDSFAVIDRMWKMHGE